MLMTEQPGPSPPRTIVPRPRPSFARRLSMRTRSWARRSFARENLINGIKTMGWVIPLTILIWIYAEREQLVTATVTIHVEPRNGDRGRFITFDSAVGPRVMSIRADLTGPHGRVEQV